MTTIQRHLFTGEPDFESLAHLINTCDAVDKLEQGTSIAGLRDSYNSSNPEKILKNICLWKDVDDLLIGYSQLSITEASQLIEENLYFIIHPNARSGNLESQIFDWSKLRLQEVNEVEFKITQLFQNSIFKNHASPTPLANSTR